MNHEEIKDLLYRLHNTTFRNEKQIQNSDICGCFYCQNIFRANEVTEWCDDDGCGDKTALCPRCGIDSVLGDASFFEITPELMALMNMMFFGEGIDNVSVKITKK